VSDLQPEDRRPGGARLAAGLLGVLLVLVGGAMVAAWALSPGFSAAGAIPPSSANPPASTSSPANRQTATRSPAPPASGPEGASLGSRVGAGNLAGALVDASFTPDRLLLPALAVDAAVVPVGLERGGGLVIPDNPQVVGWWSGGAAPGSPVGTVLLAGHVDSAQSGPGALYHLSNAPIGARFTVRGPSGEATYIVRARRRYLKQSLPWGSILAQGEVPRLVLVTCGGDFDYSTRHYTDNVIVVATPA